MMTIKELKEIISDLHDETIVTAEIQYPDLDCKEYCPDIVDAEYLPMGDNLKIIINYKMFI